MAKNGPKKEKPKAIDIIEVRRTRRFISIRYAQGDERHHLRTNENPLPSFGKALDALAPLACAIMEAPEGWALNLKVSGFKLGSMRDVRTASVLVQKGLGLSGKVLNVTTPPALLSTPQTEGAVTPPLSTVQASLIGEAEEEAKRYVKGDRAQGTLTLDDDGTGTQPEAGEELPFPAGSAGTPAKQSRSARAAAK